MDSLLGPQLGVHVRPLGPDDWDRIVIIERPLRWSDPAPVHFVAELLDSPAIIGHMSLEAHDGFWRLANLNVLPKYQRRGVGTKLLRHLVGPPTPLKSRILAEVRESNLVAQLFLRSIGFKATGIMHEFYEDDEHAIQFVYRLG